MVTILMIAVIVLSILVVGITHFMYEMKQQLEALDREQHYQNKELMELTKSKLQHQDMLLQHIEILKYLIEQDPKLNSNAFILMGKRGEA